MTVQLELSHREAKNLFGALVDEELPAKDEARLRAHLSDCDECQDGLRRYSRAVEVVRRQTRLKAPDHLATLVMRRVRRRRFSAARVHLEHLQQRVPVEAAIPVLLGALVAAMLVFLAG